ncbi:heavy-metal-associated domain-containing protein [Flavobacterium wongokense]|uniref:heavy-metal-associated domain-containing protein n=1 Tax=Flavobacterium wongokense TaxID=2910674 RepID=UPI001F41C620|nr:heavy metal-associated domain-containing protein [Flavobacterium sp. WG47]MCF6131777.1 cation transporter [Flavobacterium sp. WG47]
MNFTKSLLTFGIASTLMIGCKDASNKPAAANEEAKVEKKAVAAVKPETASFKIDGMTCAMGCAKTIETKLSNLEGVQKATVDFDKKEATVEFDATVLTPEKLTKAVETTGDGETYKVSGMKTKGKV